MKHLWEVKADHPIAKRVDEYALMETEKNDLVAELESMGYENIEANVFPHFEDGDTLEIGSSSIQSCHENDDAKNLLNHILYIKGEELGLISEIRYHEKIEDDLIYKICPLKLTIKATRTDRFRTFLQAEWETGNGKTFTTNIYGLRKMGFRFLEPESEEIPLMNASDEILYEHELVVKYYALQNTISEEEAQKVIDKVQSAMAKNGIVFYRP